MDKSPCLPVLFVGHGSPMNAIEDNFWSRSLRRWASDLPRPEAILAVSAHWYGGGLMVTAQEEPETIHDFGGFPQELFDMRYPAPGSPSLAARVAGLLGDEGATPVRDWGLDHGTWSVLAHLFPAADIPVVQLSVDARRPPAEQVQVGRKLSTLRDEGILVVGSGNVTHNLRHAMRAMATGDTKTPAWALEFDAATAKALEERDEAALVALVDSPSGRLAHPSPDHWLPLLVAYGATRDTDPVAFPVEGFDLASLSMRTVRWG